MHPEIARSIAEQRRAELRRQACLRRTAQQQRAARGKRRHAPPWLVAAGWLAAGRPLWSRRRRGGAERAVLPGVFLDRPDAFGFRTYLTAAEADQLAREWADSLSRFAGRVDDPASRPAGAVPFEVLVLGRQVPDLAGAARGLPGPVPGGS
jgi:multidrug efflux pump subunit AcrA (membrane-fusion protein)